MKNRKEWWKKNQVFFLITLIVLLTAGISLNLDAIGKNPIEKEEILYNPVQVYTGTEYQYYISDSSEKISVTDQKNRLVNTIDGGMEETSFSYADAIVSDKDGSIYILDKLYEEDGSTTYSERILKFSEDGKREAVLYETDTLNEDGEQVSFLDSLEIIHGTVYFTKVDNEGIHVYSLAGFEAKECAVMPFMNAYDRVSDTAVSDDMEIAAAMKNGDVYVSEGGVISCIYAAREHDTEDYFSMVKELAYGEDGSLYLCDVGQREVYRLFPDKKTVSTVVKRNEFSTLKSDNFAETPLYTGLNVSNGKVSVLSSEYVYDEAADEEIYYYRLAIVSEEGEVYSSSDAIGVSMQNRLIIIFVYLSILLLVIVAVYVCVKMVRMLKQMKTEENTKMQLILVLTALVITLGVSYVIFENCNSRFVKEAGEKLANVGYLIGEHIDKDFLAELDSPDDYYSGDYQILDKKVEDILQSKVNASGEMYCVIYKVKNDVVCEAYRDDMVHGAMYPMAGKYAGSIEERIAAEDDYDVCYEFALSEGTYMYALVPVYDNEHNAIAFIEAGMDYGTFQTETKSLYTKVLMLAVMAVIIVMLLFTELMHTGHAFLLKKESKKKGGICLPDLIRPISFLFFMIANMSTAFLPIYGMKLWNDSFPMQAEVAAALPLSAEMVFAAIAAFLCGYFVQKAGVKAVCILGAGAYIVGNLLSAFSPNLWMLIVANSVCGIGSGFLTIGLNTWAASYEEESMQNKGFIHINAAYLAGLNCGTVIGSLIWENFGVAAVYFVAAVGAVVIILFSLWMIGKIDVVPEETDDGEGGKLKDLFTPSVIRFFLCITVPYLVCTAFLEYFFPIEAELNGLSATHISMAFLLSGLISIYIGSSMAEPITEKLGVKKAMVLASFIYGAALFYLVINPTIWSCYVVVVLFAIADSFGLSAQSVYFSSLDEVKHVGQSKALGVNSTVESITSAGGSLIFGAALLLGTRKGIFVIASMFVILMAVFMIGERKRR